MKTVIEKNGDITIVNDGCDLVLGFNQFSQSQYYDVLKDKFDYIDCIHIGNYHYLDRGCQYEFSITWSFLGDTVVASVKIFDDCWKYMDQILPVMDMLKTFDGKVPTPNEVVEKLVTLGFVNLSRSYDRNADEVNDDDD